LKTNNFSSFSNYNFLKTHISNDLFWTICLPTK